MTMTHRRGRHSPGNKLRQQVRRTLLAEAFWDRREEPYWECIASTDGGIVAVDRGDVLFDAKGYIHPTLKE